MTQMSHGSAGGHPREADKPDTCHPCVSPERESSECSHWPWGGSGRVAKCGTGAALPQDSERASCAAGGRGRWFSIFQRRQDEILHCKNDWLHIGLIPRPRWRSMTLLLVEMGRIDQLAKISAAITSGSLDLVIHAFDNHKEHARFQETQRSWFMVAYLGISGVVWAAVLQKLFEASLPDAGRIAATIALAFLGLLGLLTGLAITKAGIEFRRHFHCAEAILAEMKVIVATDQAMAGLLSAAMLGTAGDHNERWRRHAAKHLGVAALHNYLIASLIGGEIAAIALLWGFTWPWVIGLFIGASAGAALLFLAYRGLVYSRHG